MEVRDWILIASALIVVVGWFVNGWLNRIHEIAKKRRDYRLETLHSFLPVFFAVKNQKGYQSDPKFDSALEKARSNFQLYGQGDEIDAFEKIIDSIAQGDTKGYIKSIENLVSIVRKRIRAELGLST